LTALARLVPAPGESLMVVTGLPVEDVERHGTAVRRQLEGVHGLVLHPGARRWTARVEQVHVVPQPLGTVLSQLLGAQGELLELTALRTRLGVLDVGFRTTDYFTLDGLEVLPAQCLTRNTGIADLLLDLSREIYRRWGAEVDPHALDHSAVDGTLRVGGESISLAPVLEPLLDRHAEAIAAHARMLWGDQARGLSRLWLTGGGTALLGARLLGIAPHAEPVKNPRLQNSAGYFRYGLRLHRSTLSATSR
jgi:plasmid segregation protein ParM